VTSTITGSYGPPYRINFPGGSNAPARDLTGFFDRTECGAALFSVSYVQARISLEPPIPIFDAFREFGPQGAPHTAGPRLARDIDQHAARVSARWQVNVFSTTVDFVFYGAFGRHIDRTILAASATIVFASLGAHA
jgi:hypothetical protein